MPSSNMLELALALRDTLVAELPALIVEVNAAHMPDPQYDIVAPTEVVLGIRTEMIERDLEELPAMAVGLYVRQVVEEGEQDWSEVMMPFVIDTYIGNADAETLYVQSHKWAIALDLFVERYCSNLIAGYSADEAPDIDISYVLTLRDGSFRQLITVTGVITSVE